MHLSTVNLIWPGQNRTNFYTHTGQSNWLDEHTIALSLSLSSSYTKDTRISTFAMGTSNSYLLYEQMLPPCPCPCLCVRRSNHWPNVPKCFSLSLPFSQCWMLKVGLLCLRILSSPCSFYFAFSSSSIVKASARLLAGPLVLHQISLLQLHLQICSRIKSLASWHISLSPHVSISAHWQQQKCPSNGSCKGEKEREREGSNSPLDQLFLLLWIHLETNWINFLNFLFTFFGLLR